MSDDHTKLTCPVCKRDTCMNLEHRGEWEPEPEVKAPVRPEAQVAFNRDLDTQFHMRALKRIIGDMMIERHVYGRDRVTTAEIKDFVLQLKIEEQFIWYLEGMFGIEGKPDPK